MTPLSVDFLSPAELAQIQADAAAFTTDAQIVVSISYRALGTPTFNPDTGITTRPETTTALTAPRSGISSREAAQLPGIYKVGDVRYVISRAQLVTEPTTEDQITEGAKTYNLIAWDTDPLSLFWMVVARQVR